MRENPEINEQSPFWLDDWYVDPSTGSITRGDERSKLEPKVMTVLVCLAKQQGTVISREDLESQAWPNSIVGYDALASTIIKLRKAFADDSKNSRVIETVPKKGYRLIAKIQSGDAAPASQTNLSTPATASKHKVSEVRSASDPAIFRKPLTPVFIISTLLALLVAVLIVVLQPSDNKSDDIQSGKPSIAVLPFKNISNDAQQDYFSDGITSDLITDLSKISSIWVIARNTVFTYKGIDVDVRNLREELGVDYVIEGSVRKVKEDVRISARLINTRNGFNLWADRFDGSLSNVFDLQDDVTAKIVTALELKLTEQEQKRISRKYTDSIEAYDNFLHGWQRYWEISREGNEQAREYFLKAIELDNKFARAYANLALTYAYEALNSWTSDRGLSLQQAKKYAEKAIDLDDSLPQVYWAVGFTALVNRDYALSFQAAEKIIALDPNSADGFGLFANILNYVGRTEEALENMQKAMRLNPRYSAPYLMINGEIYFNLHNYQRAIDNFKQALERNPAAQEPRLWLAAAYAYVGEVDSARWELEQIRLTDPNISIGKIESVIPLNDKEQLNHFINGLRKAGLN